MKWMPRSFVLAASVTCTEKSRNVAAAAVSMVQDTNWMANCCFNGTRGRWPKQVVLLELQLMSCMKLEKGTSETTAAAGAASELAAGGRSNEPRPPLWAAFPAAKAAGVAAMANAIALPISTVLASIAGSFPGDGLCGLLSRV